MTKTIRQLFVERLAKVGVIIVSNSDRLDRDEGLTDEQFAELDQAISDIEQAARTDERSFFREVAITKKGEPFPSADMFVEWLKDSVGHPLRVTADAVDLYVEAIRDQGKASQRAAGLNDTGELPELILPNVNAVNVTIDQSRNMFVEVDGVNRFTAGDIDRLIIVDQNSGNRFVVLRDGDPLETVPNSPVDAMPTAESEANADLAAGN